MEKIPTWKYLSEIQKLVYLADTNFLICKEIYTFLPENVLKENGFLLLTANNAFNEAIEILHTLLCSTKQEELIIKPLLEEIIDKEKRLSSTFTVSNEKVDQFKQKISEDYPFPDYFSYSFLFEGDDRLVGDILAEIRKIKRGTALQDLENLKKGFMDGGFHKVRHQSAAHKNKLLQDPAGAVSLCLKDDFIQKLGEIMKKLRILCYFWFDYELQNPNNKVIRDLGIILSNLKK